MKRLLKFFLRFALKIETRLIIRAYKPRVIAITGSVGKSSCKEAVYAVLSLHFRCRRSPGSYNNEYGLPLTIIGASSPRSHPLSWLRVLWQGGRVAFVRDVSYPEILIIEMGADRPGDLAYLLTIAKPEIGIVTKVAESHLEFFGKLEAIAKEKRVMVAALPRDGFAVLNVDDELVAKMRDASAARVVTYGFSDAAQLRASEATLREIEVGGEWGMNWKMTYEGSTVPVFLPGVLGKQQVYAALAAAAVGIIAKLNLVEVSEALRTYAPPPGRMRLLAGIKNSKIIDDSYNAAPISTIAALQVLAEVGAAGKKIAVLGDMLELGPQTQEGHREVGRYAGGITNLLVTVGELARDIASSAKEAGMDADRIFSFSTADEAKKFVQEQLREGDVTLVKGSRKMVMERLVKEIMAEPLRANELLVVDSIKKSECR